MNIFSVCTKIQSKEHSVITFSFLPLDRQWVFSNLPPTSEGIKDIPTWTSNCIPRIICWSYCLTTPMCWILRRILFTQRPKRWLKTIFHIVILLYSLYVKQTKIRTQRPTCFMEHSACAIIYSFSRMVNVSPEMDRVLTHHGYYYSVCVPR